MDDGKHTLNEMRKKLAEMSTEEKKKKLLELQQSLFVEYGREKSHTTGSAVSPSGPHTCWVLRKCIAMVKTSLHMEGFSYHPR